MHIHQFAENPQNPILGFSQMSMALFRRLDPAATGLVHQDQARLLASRNTHVGFRV